MTPDQLYERMEPAEGGCVRFRGSLNKGYAQARIGERMRRVITVIVEASTGFDRHHTCGNKWCVNRDHIEVVTRSEHLRRHAPTHCPQGHEYTPENILQGGRKCRRCHGDYQNAYRRRKRRERGLQGPPPAQYAHERFGDG